MVRRALVSVSDKTGLVPFAKRLAALGVEILSTGGTQRALADAGVPVVGVGDYTQAPEILGGRVKTRDIPPIDLVVVNLYPFREAVASGKPFAECVEEIDIGGPTMVRSAAKNSAHVGVVLGPAGRSNSSISANTLRSAPRNRLQFRHPALQCFRDASIESRLFL